MSRIDQLIAEFAPGGVDYVETARLFELRNGYTPPKSNASFWSGGTIPWFRMEDIRANGGVLDDALQRIPEAAVKGGRLFPPNSLLVATSATIGEHALITVPHLSNQRFTSLAIRAEYAELVDMKFMYYYGFVLDEWCRNNTTTSSFASVDMTGFRKFRFPVPPREVQREIVRILDQFTQLEAELEAELEARRRQYEHYRSVVLTVPSGTPSAPLGDYCRVFGGAPFKSEFFNTDGKGLPVVRIRDINTGFSGTYYSGDFDEKYLVRDGDILVGMDGDFRAVRWSHGDALLNQRVSRLQDFDGRIDPGFAFFLVREAIARIQSATQASTVKHLSTKQIASIPIPSLPLDEQRRRSSALDAFEELTNGMQAGIPAELAARRKQYEYYRDKLLTFEEAAA